MKITDPNNILNDEERVLIHKIPKIKEWEFMRELKGGFSGSKVLLGWVTYENGLQSLEVFKFGNKEEIEEEKNNWESFVKGCLDKTNVVPINHFIKGDKLSLIVYGCASYKAQVETFGEHWIHIRNPERTIEYIFSHLLNPWYSRCKFKTEDIGSFIRTFFDTSLTDIKKELNRLSIDCNKPGICITEIGRILPNPLYNDHVKFPQYRVIVPKAIIHGDLKAQNILLIERSIIIREEKSLDIEVIGSQDSRGPQDVCLIDYANTKKDGNIFSDLADLEASIKFQLLKMEYVKVDELLRLEEHICSSLEPEATASQSIRLSSAELLRLLSSIWTIRKEVNRLIERDKKIDPLSFFAHLYIHTLKSILHKEKTPLQKRYAYVSSALILEKQIAKENRKMELISIDRRKIRDYSEISFKEEVISQPTYEKIQTEPPLHLEDLIRTYLERIKEARKKERFEEHELGSEGVYIEPELMLRKEIEEKQPPLLDKELYKEGHPEKQYQFVKIKPTEFVLKKRARFVVVADSGMGKTTLLKELALMITEEELKTEFIPIYIHLRELEGCFDIQTFKVRLADRLGFDSESINHLYKDGRFLFLLDGLDQVFTWRNFPNLFGGEFFGKNVVITAGRPYAYHILKDTFKGYAYVKIENFDTARIKRYLGEIYKKEEVKELVDKNRSIVGIPIILSLLKELAKKDKLPQLKTRTAFYEKIIDRLLNVTIKLSTLQLPINEIPDKQTLKKRFSFLSYFTLKLGEIGRFSKERVFPELCDILRISPEGFKFLTRIGIIYDLFESEEEPKEIAFRHQSFQEYLAACQLKEELFKDNRFNEEVLINCLEYRYWDETIVFTIGLLDETCAEKLIKKIEGYDLYLAGLCLGEYKGSRSAFKGLIDRLFDGLFEKNEEAIKTLVRIADSQIIDRLIRLLKDGNIGVRQRAAKALGEIGSDKAIEPLILLLKDEDKNVHWSAAHALGEMGSDKAIEPLISLLKNKNENRHVRESAAKALGEIGSDKTIEPLILLLKDENEYVRLSAAHALGEIGSDKAVESLILLLKDENEDVRWIAAEASCKIVSNKAIDPLILLLRNENWYVRSNAAYVLGEIGSDKTIESLILLLKDENEYVRLSAADALGKIDPDKAIKPLILLLKSKNCHVRWRAAWALGKIDPDKAIKPLILLLKNEDWDVRWRAAEALGEIGSDKAIEPLISLLKNKNENRHVRESAAEALGEIGSDKAIESLISLLKNEDECVRLSAVEALGKIGSDKAIEPLILLLKDENWYIRRCAAETLGKIGSDKAIEPLILLLKDKSEHVRKSVAFALGKIGSDKAIDPLILLLKDEDRNVRWSAAEALGEISRKINQDEQSELILRLSRLASEEKEETKAYYNEAISKIKTATGRRFIKELHCVSYE